jgi:hypothetical protein
VRHEKRKEELAMSSSRKYIRKFKKSSFEKVSVLVVLAILTGVVSGGAIGLITGHSLSSSSSDVSSSSSPKHP